MTTGHALKTVNDMLARYDDKDIELMNDVRYFVDKETDKFSYNPAYFFERLEKFIRDYNDNDNARTMAKAQKKAIEAIDAICDKED